MAYKAEYIWIDGTEPTAKLRSKTKIIADGGSTTCPSGASTARATNQAPGDKSDCVLQPVFTCPDPIRGGDNVLVMCEVLLHRHDAAPHQHPADAAPRSPTSTPTRSRSSASSRSTRSSRTAARYGFPSGGFPAPAGRLLLRRRRRRDLRPRRRRGPPRRLPRRRPAHLRHQRRGHARPVGVPGRPASARRRSADELWIARWLLYRIGEDFGVVGHARPEARQGRLERRRRPHQLLDQGHARGLRPDHRGLRGARRRRPRSTSPTTASASRTASPASTRRPRARPSSATACRTAAPRCASRGRSRSTRRATSRIGVPTPTATRTTVTADPHRHDLQRPGLTHLAS